MKFPGAGADFFTCLHTSVVTYLWPAGSRSLDDGAGAPASVAEIQAALLQPGGGSIQQRRRVVVDAGPSYRLGRAERDARLARKADASRLERLRQVREQERLWARFHAKEFRASVADHHAELTHQLREGWLAARKAKQEELERLTQWWATHLDRIPARDGRARFVLQTALVKIVGATGCPVAARAWLTEEGSR